MVYLFGKVHFIEQQPADKPMKALIARAEQMTAEDLMAEIDKTAHIKTSKAMKEFRALLSVLEKKLSAAEFIEYCNSI